MIRIRRKSVLTTACAIAGAVALAAVSACSAVVSSATSGTSVTASPAARGTAATPGTRVTADPPAERAATSKAASTVTIAAVGDTMLAARSLIERAGREAPVVVVYMHAGAEGSAADHVTGREEDYLGEDRGNPEAFAHRAIDAGASLVIASGPHVLRGMQFYRGRLIAYSLGNFAGYRNFATDGNLDTSEILHVTLSATGRFEAARIYPVQFAGTGRRAWRRGDSVHQQAEQGGLRLERGTHLAFRRHPSAVSGRAGAGSRQGAYRPRHEGFGDTRPDPGQAGRA